MKEVLNAWWMDGREPQAHPVQLSVVSGQLRVQGEEFDRQYGWASLAQPSSVGRFDRFCRLPDGSSLHHPDAKCWDAWCSAQGHLPARSELWMRARYGALLAFLGVVICVFVAWRWLIPVFSETVAPLVSPKFEQRVGQVALAQIRSLYLKPSHLGADIEMVWRRQFDDKVIHGNAGVGSAPRWQLYVNAAPQIGPNAFALPGGDMVITDELLELLKNEPDAVIGVLAHELGHVQHQHGLKMVVKAGLTSLMVGAVLGDAGLFLSTVPAVLMTQAYSRDAERQADQFAAQFLHRNGIHPRVMVVFFERMASFQSKKKERQSGANTDSDQEPDVVSIGFSSHPANQERIAFFKNWQP
jgi:Zn-dependent protease with chaperone function